MNVYGLGPQDYTACRWMVFEIGVFAGKSRAFKEDLTFAFEEVKNEFKNVPQLEYVKISQKLAPVIAFTQEEPNTHYNLKLHDHGEPRREVAVLSELRGNCQGRVRSFEGHVFHQEP